MIFDQCRVSALDFVGTDGGADATATNGYTAVHRPARDSARQWNDEVRVVIIGRQLVSTKIDYFVTCLAQPDGQLFLQFKPTVIGCDSNAHTFPFIEPEEKLNC